MAYSKIGLHIAANCGGCSGIADHWRGMDAAGIPFTVYAVNDAGAIGEAAAFQHATLIYRDVQASTVDPKDYHVAPETMAPAYWDATKLKLPTSIRAAQSRVWVELLARIEVAAAVPKITLTIRDQRGYNLYGVSNRLLDTDLQVESDGSLRTRISFNCDLQAGEYALTLRLENALSDSFCELLDKQVNAATFAVFNPLKRFDAVVNLHGTFEPLPSPQISGNAQ